MWDKRYSGESYAYGTDANDFLREQETIRQVHEGAFHNGTSAVVQLVARKRMTAD
ncbi:MAG: hypothetical protein V3U76_03755 [Granulosicoccus sp.]